MSPTPRYATSCNARTQPQARAIAARASPRRRQRASGIRAATTLTRYSNWSLRHEPAAWRLPGFVRPDVQTGDRLLARILAAEGIAPAEHSPAFSQRRDEHGNGTIEVSARGGLPGASTTVASAPFAMRLRPSGVAALGVPVLSDPLPDDAAALIDAGALAANLRTAIADADLNWRRSCASLSMVGVHFTSMRSARTFGCTPSPRKQKTRLGIALAGDASTAAQLGSIEVEVAAEVVVEILRTIAARGDLRASDVLRAEGLGAFSELPRVRSGHIRLAARAPAE